MTENDAALRHAEDCHDATDAYFAAHPSIDTTDNRRIYSAGFDDAYTLLSKLRAEGVQAGDERAAFEAVEALTPPFASRRSNEFREGYIEAKVDALRVLRRLASAPVADDVAEVHSLTGETGYAGVAPAAPVAEQQQWRIRVVGPAGYERFQSFNGSSLDDACLAAQVQGFVCCQDEDGHVIVDDSPARTVQVQNSAPVAGEADYYAVMHGNALYGVFDSEAAADTCKAKGHPDAPFSVKPLYAAPQASEAVRNEDVVRMVYRLRAAVQSDSRASSTVETHQEAAKAEEDLIAAIGAMTTQADKDGGDCAKGAGDQRAEFEAWAVGILGDNPTWRESAPCELAWQAWTESRAAQHPRTDGGGHGS